MKSEATQIPHPKLKLKKSDFLWTLIPALLWLVAILLRPSVITPRCKLEPEKCSRESLMEVDRLSFKMEDRQADGFSYWTQNLSGVLAVGVPALWTGSKVVLGSLNPGTALVTAGFDLILILQTASWNGFFTELSHLLVQRPRPFVYYDPRQRGIDSAHYTSFYSGHTSFTAAMTVGVFLIFYFRGASVILLLLSVASAEALVISTAYFRILAGRHFLTDVIFGAVAGTLTAWIVMSRSRFFRELRLNPCKERGL